MVPLSKNDLSSVEKLTSATDEEVIEKLPQLLEWFQDYNWPVFPAICERISKLTMGTEEQIRKILVGDDIIWKCCIVGHLFPKMEIGQIQSYEKLLQNLLVNASMDDYKEGFIDYVEIQLSRIAKNT